jgi:hypothetical protein
LYLLPVRVVEVVAVVVKMAAVGVVAVQAQWSLASL